MVIFVLDPIKEKFDQHQKMIRSLEARVDEVLEERKLVRIKMANLTFWGEYDQTYAENIPLKVVLDIRRINADIKRFQTYYNTAIRESLRGTRDMIRRIAHELLILKVPHKAELDQYKQTGDCMIHAYEIATNQLLLEEELTGTSDNNKVENNSVEIISQVVRDYVDSLASTFEEIERPWLEELETQKQLANMLEEMAEDFNTAIRRFQKLIDMNKSILETKIVGVGILM